MNDGQKQCFVSFDEIHVKPGLYYQGKYVVGNALNVESSCPAKTILALMVNPSYGAPAFTARLIPVYNVKADFVYGALLELISWIHEAGVLFLL